MIAIPLANRTFSMLSCALLSLCFLTTRGAFAQFKGAARSSTQVLHIDASVPFVVAGPADFRIDFNQAPDGRVIGVNERYLTLNGKPWLPVMGELHYSRVPEGEWEDEILKMKAAGVDIISSYIFWIHHEEIQGEWDWSTGAAKGIYIASQHCAQNTA